MKNFSASLKASYANRITTIAHCAKIIRLDGTTYTFTSHDVDLIIDTELYRSSYAFNPTAYASALGLQIENMEIEGAVDELFIDDFDIIKNKFYGAEVWFFSVDYKNLDYGKNKILYGTVGEIEVTDKIFKMEVRGISKKYTNLYSSYYGKMCRARLGDDKCGINLNAEGYKVLGSVYDEQYSSSSIDCKYLKLQFHTSQWLNYLQIYEIKLFDRLGNNLCTTHLESLASTENDDFKCGDGVYRSPNNLIDNNPSTYTCLDPIAGNYYIAKPLLFTFSNIVSISAIEIIDTGSGTKVDGVTITGSKDSYTWSTYTSNMSMSSYRSTTTIKFPFYYILSNEAVKRVKFVSNQVAPFEENYFQYGYVKWLTGLNAGVQSEVIQSLTDGSIELAIPMPYNIHTDDTFEIYVGCNHLLIGRDGTPYTGHCFSKFKNVINFRGEPYLPNEDVILSGFVATMNERETEDESTSAVLEPV